MGGGRSEIEESKRSSVDIDNILDPDGAPARRILYLEVIQRPPVVTRFGRVVKVDYLGKYDALRGWSVTWPRSVTRITLMWSLPVPLGVCLECG